MNNILAIADKAANSSKLKVREKEKFDTAISCLYEGSYFITIEKIYNKRTDQQRKAQFAVPYKIIQACIIDSTGEYVSKDWVHEF